MPEPVNIQEALDQWLAENPAAQKYISKLYYVADGTDVPADATHKVRLSSMMSDERQLTIAAVVLPQFAAFLDMILAMIATQGGVIPPGVIPEKKK